MDKITYKSAGVDKQAGYESVEKIKKYVAKTMNDSVLGGLGSFGGCVELPKGYKNPVLVSGTDGVGTKLMIAREMDRHDTVGIDLVAMCVNDVLCSGAKPLYFLDYIACGKNRPDKIADIVKGIADGCIEALCPLIGGETAEMPGMYGENDYDLAGFCSGIVEKEKMITGASVRKGDVLIGLSATGLHSNGFSLVRKICFELKGFSVGTYIPELSSTLGEALLTPTAIYVKQAFEIIDSFDVHGMCNITGGGYIENIPRMIPDGLCAKITPVKSENPIYEWIAKAADIEPMELYATFNMGAGFVMAVSPHEADACIRRLAPYAHKPFILGEVTQKDEKIEICL